MKTEEIWDRYGQELYFFVLKNVKDKEVANDVFQNSFLKIHDKIAQLQSEEKARSWVFQIGRNEIANYYNKEQSYYKLAEQIRQYTPVEYDHVCCFDRFIDDLSENYKAVIELIYVEGKKQDEVADILDISLANVKARVRRAKEVLKCQFQACCKFELTVEGKLKGTDDCPSCH